MTTDLRAAVFLDRDGTLIEDVGVLKNPDDIRLYPDTVDALRLLQKNYKFFVISNQSGVIRGEITIREIETIHQRLAKMLRQKGVTIEKWYVCPHDRSDRCQCIKPNPTFMLQAADEFGLSLSRSFTIGDHPHDVSMGDKVGAFGLYVLTGHGTRHLSELPESRLLFHSLKDAAKWIAAHPRGHTDIRESVESGAEAIRRGGLVAFPTETVYGLGADVFNADAVAKIFEVKERPLYDPLIAHVSDLEQAETLAENIPPLARRLMERFWPGPLSLVLPKSDAVPDVVTAGQPTIAIRMPRNPIARDLIRRAETPIAAPSANRFGRISPTAADHVASGLSGGYDVLIDGGACRVGIESTVVAVENNVITLLRPGGISIEELESVEGARVAFPAGRPVAQSPGMLPSHYAPNTPMRLFEEIPEELLIDEKVGKLLFKPIADDLRGPFEVLSPRGNLREAAANLYAAMRRLDALDLRLIVSRCFPADGLGRALNDRISRAAAKNVREVG